MSPDNGNKASISRSGAYLPLAFIGLLMVYIGGMSCLHPLQGDDFAFACLARGGGIFTYLADTYCNWTIRLGEVFNLLLLSGGKTVFNLVNPFLQLALAVGLFRFAFQRKLNWKNRGDLLFLALLFALSAVLLARPRDTVFWMTGSNVYAFGLALWFGFWGAVTTEHQGEDPKRRPGVAMLLFLWGAAAATTLENCALCGILVGSFRIVSGVIKKRKLPAEIKWALGGYFFGLTVFLTQPGRWQRLQHAEIIRKTLGEYLALLVEVGLFHAVAAFAALILLAVVGAALLLKDRERFRRELPHLALLVFYSAAASGCFIIFGITPAMRAYWFSALFIGMAAVRLLAALYVSGDTGKLCAEIICIATFGIAGIRIGGAIPEFCRIARDTEQREKIIRQSAPGSGVVTVPEYSSVRKTFSQYIWIEDITEFPDNPFNVSCAEYYRIPAIKIDHRTPIPLYWKKR